MNDKKIKYEVQLYTLCQGWINTWSIVDDNRISEPHLFESIEDAQAELDEFFEDIQSEIDCGDRQADEGHDREDFRIVRISIT